MGDDRPRASPPFTRRKRKAEPCGQSTVARSLDVIKRYELAPEEIDDAILAAINVSLCLESDGDYQVCDGFNHDIVINGRGFTSR